MTPYARQEATAHWFCLEICEFATLPEQPFIRTGWRSNQNWTRTQLAGVAGDVDTSVVEETARNEHQLNCNTDLPAWETGLR